jgi:hypothetical protein
MGGNTNVEAPQPSPEERALQGEQLTILREQRDLTQLLLPATLRLSGFEPEFGQIQNPEFQALQNQLEFLESGRSGGPGGIATDEQRQAEIQRVRGQLEGLSPTIQSTSITGVTQIEDPNRPLREEIETGFLERTRAALAGELPVNPALLRELGEQEETLRESLRKQLGTGFETSSPGIEALATQRQRSEELIEGARRGDLTLAEQLGIARQSSNEQSINQLLARVGGAANFQNPLISQFGSALQPFQFNRQQQFQANAANAQLSAQSQQGIGQFLGLAAGAGIGFAAGGPVGGLQGASAASNIFR